MPAVGRNAPERSYLSIREVLELLVAEFPDVTISKIRFLESRGLIHPERTPSGYRKFYEGDVERLRWILLQQRENFLPLKVIKGRLDRSGATAELPSEPSLFDAEPEQRPPGEGRFDEPAPNATPGGTLGGRGSDEPPRPPDSSTPPAPGPVAGERTEEPGVPDASSGTERPIETEPAARRDSATEPVEPAESRIEPDEAERDPLDSSPTTGFEGAPAGASLEPEHSGPAPVGADANEKGEPSSNPASGPTAPATDEAASTRTEPAERHLLGDVNFSLGELLGASGASPELVNALIEFGLVEPKVIAGVTCFDSQSVEVCRIAVGFARFGIEPRHLRSLKHAAERQAALYSQVVTPLLRQRNPASRERARADLAELAGLGVGLTELFVSATLRDLTGG